MYKRDLFQAIFKVNRVNGEEKDYGYIVDYQNLFDSIRDAIDDYTSENTALGGYDEKDVEGLLKNRLKEAKRELDDALQSVITLSEVVEPQSQVGYFAYFVYNASTPFDKQSGECESTAQKREI